jgi:hypothetical protein
MTPLLHGIMKELAQPLRKRKVEFHDLNTREFTKLIAGAHSFECSGVLPLAANLAAKVVEGMIERNTSSSDVVEGVTSKTTAFLPAERTWIEFVTPKIFGGPRREAMLFIDEGRTNITARCIWLLPCRDDPNALDIAYDGPFALASERRVAMPTLGGDNAELGESILQHIKEEFPDGRGSGFIINPESLDMSAEAIGRERKQFVTARSYALLGMINTPRIFQRIVHQPHSGLNRKMVAAKPLLGKFPLGAWTEILLKVPAPEDGPKSVSGAEGYLSGERALHWCRAHLRYRLGQWEIVSDHWRGNPAIGIKQSRYRLEVNNV